MGVVKAISAILGALPARWPVAIPLPITPVVAAALLALITSWVAFDQQADLLANPELLTLDPKCQGTRFDFIIVGAGAAGMVVATRLANASSNSRILLLEAGGEPSVVNDIPGLDTFLISQPANHYTHHSPPNPNCCQNYDGQVSVTTAGKMLGGSTAHNFMMYARGHKEDFNRWAQDAGDPTWNYEAVLPYFKKSEDYTGEYANDADSSTYHGRGGLLSVSKYDFAPGADQFLAAGVEKGYSIGDYNGANQEVFSKIDVTTQDGWREHTYKAYYRDTGKPANLCIKKYATVVKVNFRASLDGRPSAVGVTYKRQGLSRTVTAAKEVILSAGTMATSKLLLLSGVGPSSNLKSLKIPLVKDLPVGHNLQDHVFAIVGPFLKSPSLNPKRDFTAQSAVEFLDGGNGILAAPNGIAGQAFFQSPLAEPPYPDLQAIQFSFALYPELASDMNGMLGVNVTTLNAWLEPYQKQNLDARFVGLVLGRPKSVGTIKLASTNPDDVPIVDPRFLEDPQDVERLLYGFKKIVDLYENTTALNASLFHKPVPGCEAHPFKSDDYYRCAIRHYTGSLWHQVGTCALGKVVDSQLKVIGIVGLRVIDASVIPRTPNANTQAATIMVAEKGADLLIADLPADDMIKVTLPPRIDVNFNPKSDPKKLPLRGGAEPLNRIFFSTT